MEFDEELTYCDMCGEEVFEVDENGLCEDCEAEENYDEDLDEE